MNDLKFALRQLLKNPGFTAAAVLRLALASRSLASENAPDLPVIKAHFDDEVSAAAPNVIARAITDPPARLARTCVLGCCNQALLQFDAFTSGAVIGGGYRSGQRYRQFVFQNRSVQYLWHAPLWSSFRQDAFGFAEFNDVSGRRDKIEERRRNNMLPHVPENGFDDSHGQGFCKSKELLLQEQPKFSRL